MAQFKPMVKMMTNEPSVILKLKKGGKVSTKMQHKESDEHGHKAMSHEASEAEEGCAPKKPSMGERRKAMNPNQYAKGGKVAHKQIGGVMPMGAAPQSAMMAPRGSMMSPQGAAAPAPMAPMARNAIAQMAPAARMARAAMVRKALTGMKKGGSADAKCAALEKELKHHESMPMSKAHPMKKASGGMIDKFDTKTTIEGNAGKYAKTKMDTAKKDRIHGTGIVKEGKPGGYAMGGTIEGNEKAYENTKMVNAKRDTAHGTGGIKEQNAGGYAKGGKVPGVGRAIEGGDWENRPANGTPKGKVNGTTGGVKEANAGGYKMGGAAKKHFATGGNVVDDGKAEKMPRHFVSRPVANSLQSGTFKKGGKVQRFETGDRVIDNETARMAAEKKSEREENEGMRNTILGAPGRAFNAVKSLFGSEPKPAGSVTKTEKSVTVSPGKKRGGSAKC